MKIFIGLTEIAGYYTNLENGDIKLEYEISGTIINDVTDNE